MFEQHDDFFGDSIFWTWIYLHRYLKILLSKGNFTFSIIFIVLNSRCCGLIIKLKSPGVRDDEICSKQNLFHLWFLSILHGFWYITIHIICFRKPGCNTTCWSTFKRLSISPVSPSWRRYSELVRFEFLLYFQWLFIPLMSKQPLYAGHVWQPS